MKKGEIFVNLPKQFHLKVKIVADSQEFVPQYQTDWSACRDLVANLTPLKYIDIEQLETVMIDCGFKIELPTGYEAQIRARSGLASKGIIVTNSPGTIDEDYRKKIKVILTNLNKQPFRINHLDRIAQICFNPVYKLDLEEVVEIQANNRGGIGSTGK